MNLMTMIKNFINKFEYGEPIFTIEIYNYVVKENKDINRAVVNEYVKRFHERNKYFVRYSKGIYYNAEETPFGLSGIDKTKLIDKMYLTSGKKVIGFETGPSYMNKIGLTTQVPKFTYIVTKNMKTREPIGGIKLVAPITDITDKNYRYLQLIDIVNNKFKVKFETDEIEIYRNFIDLYKINFEKLMYYAKYYNNEKIYKEIARIARG